QFFGIGNRPFDLLVGHNCRKRFQLSRCLLFPCVGSRLVPHIGGNVIEWYSPSLLVQISQIQLCTCKTLFGGGLCPFCSLGVVQRQSRPCVGHPGKVLLCRRISALGCGVKPFGRLGVIPRQTLTAKID